jgi:hypothetical protein
MLWVQPVGDHRSQAILARSFLPKRGDRQEKKKARKKLRAALNQTGFLCKEYGANAAAGKSGCSEEINQKNIRDAHRGVQSSDERAGRGSVAAPSPRAPQPCSHSAAAVFFSNPKKGTFLMS